jgi:hypothetical protein
MNWKAAERQFPGKSSQQIFERWTKVLDPSVHKGSWTRQEDETIIRFVQANGCKSWTKLAKLLSGRIGKQCRERWLNHLDPTISRGPWTPEEDKQLMLLHEQYGNRWSQIAALMPNRADNMIKNRWYSTLAKKTPQKLVEAAAKGPTPPRLPSLLPLQADGMPVPALDDGTWPPTLGGLLTPMRFGATPGISSSPGLISPMVPSPSPFALMSPLSKIAPRFSLWGEAQRSAFASPAKVKASPPTLLENRAELVNLIINQ